MTGPIGAIVVHHRSYETVGHVVIDLIAQGIGVTDIVVVDNSVEDTAESRLHAAIPEGVAVLFTRNGGYGAAVNQGVRALQRKKQYEFLLIATHEVRLGTGSVLALERALVGDPRVGAAGPTLLTTKGGREEVWSTGGSLTRWARVPRHHDHRTDPDELLSRPQHEAVPRQWLDGAFVMYRTSLLSTLLINEIFFLYVEEVDLHTRIRRRGFDVVWVPGASAHQTSNGTPPFYLGRNLVILHRLNRDYIAIVFVPFVALRASLPQALRQRSVRPILQAARGIVRGLSDRLER